MIYNKEDIRFEEITPAAFENLCYDLILNYGFQDLLWREGAADNGRDIEASYIYNNPIKTKTIKYFFECKHYTSGGVPPEHLNSKIAWADAEQPDILVFITSSHLTNNARTWLDALSPQKNYEIICIESEELKDRLIKYPTLIERYFSHGRYTKMLLDVKDYKIKFNVNPSYELLKEIVVNIELDKLDTEDISFLLFEFYRQFTFFMTREEFYGDFNENLLTRLLQHLKITLTDCPLNSFDQYHNNYDILGGDGFIEEGYNVEYELPVTKFDFQFYDIHFESQT